VGDFVLVVAGGHCGTRWLANTLHRPEEGVVFYHERKNRLMGGWSRPWRIELASGLGHSAFKTYFDTVGKELKRYRIVGDSVSWLPSSVPNVNEVVPVNRIIVLVRNGILQVRSKSSCHGMGGHIEACIHDTWERFDKPFGDWANMTDWEKWCFDWWSNYAYADWLRKQLPDTPQEILRLEDLTSDAECLELLFASFKLSRKDIATYQKKRVNPHVPPLTPERVWQRWSSAQKEAYRRICGEAALKLGYRVY